MGIALSITREFLEAEAEAKLLQASLASEREIPQDYVLSRTLKCNVQGTSTVHCVRTSSSGSKYAFTTITGVLALSSCYSYFQLSHFLVHIFSFHPSLPLVTSFLSSPVLLIPEPQDPGIRMSNLWMAHATGPPKTAA